jgi:hypothetical protein
MVKIRGSVCGSRRTGRPQPHPPRAGLEHYSGNLSGYQYMFCDAPLADAPLALLS